MAHASETLGYRRSQTIDANIVAVISLMAVFALSVGTLYPALTLNLEARGFSATVIGSQAVAMGLAIVVSSFATPVLAMRYGTWPVCAISLVGAALGFCGFAIHDHPLFWFLVRFVGTLCITTTFVIAETWLNELTADNIRGRVIGIYTAIIAGFFALGPVIVTWIGYEHPRIFFIQSGLMLILSVGIFRLKGRVPPPEPVSYGHMLGTFAMIPILLAAVAFFGLFDAIALGLWIVYAIDLGQTGERAAYMLTALILGNLLFQVPIGWLADKTSPRRVFILCCIGTFIGSLMLWFMDLGHWTIWPFLVVWGSIAFGMFTVAMILIGKHLTGARLIAANAGFGLFWGTGSLMGGAIAGQAMDTFGPAGLPGVLILFAGLLLAGAMFVSPVRPGSAER